ncbi:hypothetical protein A3194_05295 [Candidatus Thiodiazotropha endoloripes]|uniref:hypothetical protein n=1 Tax=Candidatus Thiodiazotropha endoloripes TaxID=1818881 RepID=UPI00083DAFC8|nr:hypothetical protein [Candidatus Thiodiazotropha endoloripes]ODB94076.1 hypothetical protein A3194_05295 [Candidatus Thiodiazotropha endoloripes]
MPLHKDTSTWKGKATDIAYKDPFSEVTTKTRKHLIFWSSITLLNNYYPIDLASSHVLGFKFAENTIPPLNALLVVIVIYTMVIFVVYVAQEIQAWFAQANEVLLIEYRTALHDIYAHHGNVHGAIIGVLTELRKHSEELHKLRHALETGKEIDFSMNNHLLEVHKQSVENFSQQLGDSNIKYEEDILKAKELLKKSTRQYKSALFWQTFRVMGFEVLFPLILSITCLYLSSHHLVKMIQVI